MAKLLFFALLVVVVYLLLKRPGRSGAPPRQRPGGSAEEMVACARCGLNVPVGESVEKDGRRYCCQEHLRLDAGDRS